MGSISGIAFGLIAGVIGWTAAEFFGKPIRRGIDLVLDARVEVVRHGNEPALTLGRTPIGPKSEHERLKKAQDAFCELGAKFHAFAKTEYIATRALSLLGLDLLEAATALIGLSNTMHEYGSASAMFFDRVEHALRFKRD